jgi:hypothetical protein
VWISRCGGCGSRSRIRIAFLWVLCALKRYAIFYENYISQTQGGDPNQSVVLVVGIGCGIRHVRRHGCAVGAVAVGVVFVEAIGGSVRPSAELPAPLTRQIQMSKNSRVIAKRIIIHNPQY